MKDFFQTFRFLFWFFRTEEFPDLLKNSNLPGTDFDFLNDGELESIPFSSENLWQYRVLKNDTAEICGWTGSGTVLSIPESLAGHRVSAIGRNAFHGRTDVEELWIPESIFSIGTEAFSRCSKLRKITLPPSLFVIGEGAFEHCVALEEIRIPNSVMLIEDGAFSGCRSLRSVPLNEGLSAMGEAVFSDCSALESIRLPASLEAIGNWLFGNSGIKEVFVYRYSEGEKYCRNHWIPYRLIEKPQRLHNPLRGLLNGKKQM